MKALRGAATLAQQVAATLMAHRNAAGLKQGDVSRRMKVAQSTVSRIEAGETELTVAALARYCEALRILPSDILERAERAAAKVRE